jgi:hypothetical protein
VGVSVIYKTPGNWWVFVHHNGRRKSKAIGKDKGLALQVAEKI